MPVAQSTKSTDWRDAPIAVYTDPIFFAKYNIHVGTRLIYYGRTASGKRLTVEAIWTFKSSPHGRLRSYVTSVQKLDDILELRGDDGTHWERTFSYCSYSSLYRLEESRS